MTKTRSRDARFRPYEIDDLFRSLIHSSFEFVSDFEIRISDFCLFGNAFRGVASQMTWDISYDSWEQFPVSQKWFATGEAIAHLRCLEEEGKIVREPDAAKIIYSLNHEAS